MLWSETIFWYLLRYFCTDSGILVLDDEVSHVFLCKQKRTLVSDNKHGEISPYITCHAALYSLSRNGCKHLIPLGNWGVLDRHLLQTFDGLFFSMGLSLPIVSLAPCKGFPKKHPSRKWRHAQFPCNFRPISEDWTSVVSGGGSDFPSDSSLADKPVEHKELLKST